MATITVLGAVIRRILGSVPWLRGRLGAAPAGKAARLASYRSC
jgi:hypothetical protein